MKDSFRIVGLSEADRRCVRARLGRPPTLTEQALFAAMWSEHCSYRSSRRLLKTLPRHGAAVIGDADENAGVVDIGDGLRCVFKIESHNHPSFIEPYHGAATAVGGIVRDILAMGARPVAGLNALRFGDGACPRMRHLIDGVVRGLADYGNCLGVPMVGGETGFDSSYNDNILVNAMTIGIVEAEHMATSRASDSGLKALYVGARTGRDGIHGAAMASSAFDDDVANQRPAIQIGDPLAGKGLIEACLEAVKTGKLAAMQDMGAAGLTSSATETAGKGGLGMTLDLDAVPLREDDMDAHEIMLSESQERMLLLLEERFLPDIVAIFRKRRLEAAVIGETVDDGMLRIRRRKRECAAVPIDALLSPPDDPRPIRRSPIRRPKPPRPASRRTAAEADGVPSPPELGALLQRFLGTPSLCSRRWIHRQYDSTVMADTCAGPGGDAAIIRVHGTDKRIALTVDSLPRYVRVDPRQGTRLTVMEARRNLIAVGAEPLAITDGLNFGNPERPEIMGQLAAAIEGLADAARAFDLPVVSGNVSLYNETRGRAIDPTPIIGMIGLIAPQTPAVGIGTADGATIALLDNGAPFCASGLCDALLAPGLPDPPPPPAPDPARERVLGECLLAWIAAGRVGMAHDVSEGGLAVALAESALAGRIGIRLNPDFVADRDFGFWFGETQGRFLIGFDAADAERLEEEARRDGLNLRILGEAGGAALSIGDGVVIDLETLRTAREACIPQLMA